MGLYRSYVDPFLLDGLADRWKGASGWRVRRQQATRFTQLAGEADLRVGEGVSSSPDRAILPVIFWDIKTAEHLLNLSTRFREIDLMVKEKEHGQIDGGT